MKGFKEKNHFVKHGFKWLRVVFYGFRWLILADHLLGFLWRQVAFNGLKWLIVVLIMSDGKQSYRVNFTMPKPDSALNSKINELFLRHRDIGTLRHWLMSLATEEAIKELSGRSEPSSAPTAALAVRPKKIESFADLLPDSDDGEPVPRKAKSKELEVCESIEDEDENTGDDSEDWDEFFEKHKPLRLSDM